MITLRRTVPKTESHPPPARLLPQIANHLTDRVTLELNDARGRSKGSKRFFLKKEAKTFIR